MLEYGGAEMRARDQEDVYSDGHAGPFLVWYLGRPRDWDGQGLSVSTQTYERAETVSDGLWNDWDNETYLVEMRSG